MWGSNRNIGMKNSRNRSCSKSTKRNSTFLLAALGLLVALPALVESWTPGTVSSRFCSLNNRRLQSQSKQQQKHEWQLPTQARGRAVVALCMTNYDHREDEEHRHPSPHHDNISNSHEGEDKKEAAENELSHNVIPDNSSPTNRRTNITHDVLKKMRVAKAQAEIDRILNGPDAPIDTEAELEKVVSMSASPPSEQPLLDAEISQLESELYQAVKQQDFSLAKEKKSDLAQLQDTFEDGSAILAVNAAFYRAFSQKSWEGMERVWLTHDDSSVCIHPSHKPLVGARRILKSWKQMFASNDGTFQRNWMEPHNIRLVKKGSHLAVITCEEHVFARRFVRGKKRQTELINKLLASNIFRKVGNQWYLWYHHASWHPESEAAKRALNGGNNGITANGKLVSDTDPMTGSNLAAGLAAKRRKRRRQQEDDEDEDYEENIGMDGILGSDFGPLIGNDPPAGNNNQDGKPVKRVIMGSLSDILGGGLDSLLGGGSEDDQAGDANPNKNKNPGVPQEGTIIQFSRIEDDDDEDEDDSEEELYLTDDDDDDDDEDDDDGDDNHERESVAIINEWAKSTDAGKRKNSASNSGGNNKTSSGAKWVTSINSDGGKKGKSSVVFKDTLRQNCISALRKLADQGSISAKQKRVLLTDIITCSSKGEFSMVEVAYELLCGEGDDEDEDTAEEEFAEQCRVFAETHLEGSDVSSSSS